MASEGHPVPVQVEEVDAQVAVRPAGAGERAASAPAEAHELVVRQIAGPRAGVEVLLRDDAGPDVFVGPLAAGPVVVVGERALDLPARRGDVKGGPVAAYREPAGVVGALQHEALGERIEVDVVEAVPHPQGGHHVLGADAVGHPLLDLVLVDKLCIQRVAVVNLQPLELLVESRGVFEIEGAADPRSVQELQVTLVGPTC